LGHDWVFVGSATTIAKEKGNYLPNSGMLGSFVEQFFRDGSMADGKAAYKNRHVTFGPGWMYHEKSSTLLQTTSVEIPGFPIHHYMGSDGNYSHKIQVQSNADGLKWNHGNEEQGGDPKAEDFYETSAAGSPETNFVFVHNFNSKQFGSTDDFHQEMNFAKLQGMGCQQVVIL